MSSLIKYLVYVVLTAVAYYAIHIVQYNQRRKGRKLPPGPKGVPILGNLPELTKAGDVIPVFKKWAKDHGPIVRFEVMGNKQVLLSTQKAAQDLLAKRGIKYSDRPIPHAPRFIDDHSLVLLDRDEVWQREHRVLRQAVTASLGSDGKWLDMMDDEAARTIRELWTSPTKFVDHFQRFAYGVLTRPFLGFSVETAKDPFVLEQEHFLYEGFKCFRPKEYPSNLLPFLRWLPFLPAQRKLIELRDMNRKQKSELREQVKKQSREDGVESIYRQFIEDTKDFRDVSDVELSASFAAIMSGGAKTLYIGLLTISFLMLLYPEWQKKAHEHLDEVIGPERMPTMNDIPRLHLIRALVKEGIRYHALVANIGVPHKLTEDDEYEGFFFEKGTAFFTNAATILMNPDEYPDQEKFNPARWIEPSYPTYREPLTVYPNCKNFTPFGFGRRACPGYDLAESTLTIVIAKMLWAFDLQIPLTATGEPEKINIEYEPPPSKTPKEFPCKFISRRDTSTQVIQNLLAV